MSKAPAKTTAPAKIYPEELSVLKYPNPVLRKVAARVTEFDDELRRVSASGCSRAWKRRAASGWRRRRSG